MTLALLSLHTIWLLLFGQHNSYFNMKVVLILIPFRHSQATVYDGTNLSLVDEYFKRRSSLRSGVCVKILTIPSTSPMALCLSEKPKWNFAKRHFLVMV